MFKRPPEKMEDTKIVKFGETRLRSPSPVRGASVTKTFPERKVSAPPTMNYSPLPYNMNGNSDMLNFMNLLEREESDFVDQVKKSKAFIQSVIRDKEELGVIVANQSNKISKLEGERMEYQKKIIESEREKRDFHDKLEQERQAGIQALKKLEKQKRDLERLQQESAAIARERNEAVGQLGEGMRQLERLEAERSDMLARIEVLNRDQQDNRRPSSDMSKAVGDLNMKLKMEIGALKEDKEDLAKRNDQIRGQLRQLEEQLQLVNRELREKEEEAAESTEMAKRLAEETKGYSLQIQRLQEEARHQSGGEDEAKVQIARLKSEQVAATDRIAKLQKELGRMEAEKKDGLNKMQVMHAETKELRRALEEFEANKASEIKNLEASLTKSLTANKQMTESLAAEKRIVAELEQAKSGLQEDIEKLQIDNRRRDAEIQGYVTALEKKKKAEEEMLATIKDLEGKVEKIEDDKKAAIRAEKMRKSSVATREKEEKKEWEEKMEKLKIQFDRAAVESKKTMTRLEEENSKLKGYIEEVKTDLEKKEVECRTLNTKLTSLEKEFTRYKTWAKAEADKCETTVEEMEARISEGRRNAESWRRKHDSVQNDLEAVIKEKYALKETIDNLNEDISNLKEELNDEKAKLEEEKTKVEKRLQEANFKIKGLEGEKVALAKSHANEMKEVMAKVDSLKEKLKTSTNENQDLLKRLDTVVKEKDQSFANDIKKKEKELKEKEKELQDLRQVADIKERKLQNDIDRVTEEQTRTVQDLGKEIEKLQKEINAKQNEVNRLEKEKKEVSLAKDKTKKTMDDLEKEREKLKESLAKLESEKKNNNFGKYEKEKMKMELDNVSKEKQTFSSRLSELNKEKLTLQETIKDLSKFEALKKELEQQNKELDASVADLKSKNKELEISVKKEKENAKTLETSSLEKSKQLLEEKNNLKEKIDKLESEVKRYDKELNSVKGELGRAKSSLVDKEKQCKAMAMEDSNMRVLSDRIVVLEKNKEDLDKKVSDLEAERNALHTKVSGLEATKKMLDGKVKDLEKTRDDMKKKLADLEKQKPGDKKSAEELQKLQKENKELRKEKEELNKTLKEAKAGKDVKNKKPAAIDKGSVLALNGECSSSQFEMSGLLKEKTEALEKLKQNFDSLLKDLESRTAEIEKLTSQLNRSKTDCSSAVEKLRKSESELSQIKEKNAQLSDELLNKSRTITAMENSGRLGNSSSCNPSEDLLRQVEDLKRRLAEAHSSKPKKSVKFSAEPEILNEPVRPEKVKELEEALAAAYAERHEIIESCRKEVEFHRTIASELESSIMEDFEWKLHEIEKDYNTKLKQSRETMDEQIKEACRGILREKDEEIRKLQVQLRKDMDEQLKKEKEELKKALECLSSGEADKGIEVLKKDLQMEFAQKQKRWEEKRKKYHKEIDDLKKKLQEKEEDLKKGSVVIRKENDTLLFEERRKADKMAAKFQEDHDKLRDELNGEISRLKADYDEKIEDYEQRLEKALADKVEKMLILREEVEVEYAEKMDELRTMYRDEMNGQVEAAERDKAKMQMLESSLQESLKAKRQECEELRSKYESSSTQVDDLQRRLNNQTEEVMRLTLELESYEYQDAQS